jgi:[protein-PII] uridylyltransferase
MPALASLSDAFRRLRKRWVLMLAVLLHDLGKAFRTEHEARGRDLAGQVLTRFGVAGEDRDRILFVIGNHLAMSVLSQRRELDDRKVIEEFRRTVGDRENLSLLYLLTYADMTAVSPQSWTPWKATLLQDLYLRTLATFERTEDRPAEEQARSAAVAGRLREAAAGRFTDDEIAAFLASMPPHYRATASAGRMLRHLEMVRRLPAEQLVIEHRQRPARGCTELTVCAYDAYGMFFRTAGTLAAQNLNIQRAQIFTARNGIMIDTFEVTDAAGNFIAHQEVWDTVKAELRDVLAGGRRPHEVRVSAYERALPGAVEASVTFDNESSDALTIIDLVARDRVGLLYRITKALYDLNLDIASAKIVTEGIRVMDSFYVSDLLRQKIKDPDRLSRIRAALLAVLGGEGGRPA